MANNYQDIVGEITLKQVTPVIRAVFKCYNLSENPQSPGVYAFCTGESFSHFGLDSDGTWGDFAEDLLELAAELNINDNDYAAGDYGFGLIVKILLRHFGQINHPSVPELIRIAKEASEYDNVEMWYLFDLAKLLDDGHGLQAYTLGSAWYCSKPRPGEFGGYAEFQDQHVKMYRTSSTVDFHAPAISTSLSNQDYEMAAKIYTKEANALIDGVIDPQARQQVARHVIKSLDETYSGIPATQPASNDSVGSIYEQPAVTLTTHEKWSVLAEAVADIVDKYRDLPAHTPPDLCVRAALSDMVGLLSYGNGTTVPPFHLYPIHAGRQFKSKIELLDTIGDKLAGWEYQKPFPLTGEKVDDSFSTHCSNAVEQRRINAAKKMFG